MTTRKRSIQPPDRAPFVMPRPQRTGPQRMLATVGRFDDAKPDAEGTNPARGRPLASTKDVIEHAIRVAQEVIDQQIGSGERILRYLRRAPVSKRRKSALDGKSGASLSERTMAVSNELGVLAIEAMETIAESKTVVEVISRWLGLAATKVDGTGAGAPAASAPANRRVDVFVSSRKPAKVEARLFTASAGRVHVAGLHCAGAPSIDAVGYLEDQHAFHVSISDYQPVGVYWGVIVDEDQQPVGTIGATVTGA